MTDIPCKCGHIKSEHYNYSDASQWCGKCFYTPQNSTKWQHPYYPDNLKYLEQIYEKAK